MSAKRAKLIRGDMKAWISRGLNDRGIAIQASAPERKVRRERARLSNITARNDEKRKHENPDGIIDDALRVLKQGHL